jgi:hypothetical protein
MAFASYGHWHQAPVAIPLKQTEPLSLSLLQAQLGKVGQLLWRLSHGEDPLIPRQTQGEVTKNLTYSEPASVLSTILIAPEVLVPGTFAALLSSNTQRGWSLPPVGWRC